MFFSSLFLSSLNNEVIFFSFLSPVTARTEHRKVDDRSHTLIVDCASVISSLLTWPLNRHQRTRMFKLRWIKQSGRQTLQVLLFALTQLSLSLSASLCSVTGALLTHKIVNYLTLSRAVASHKWWHFVRHKNFTRKRHKQKANNWQQYYNRNYSC